MSLMLPCLTVSIWVVPAEHNCQNEINDVVPIAVGAALTGLVIIVMIAYFIGRRRSRRLAYQSV